tara:strand:+ start:133 stop:438 length:306 start_codon:yes stop_codon:yes gene_type:complete
MSFLDTVSGIYATNAPGFVYPFPTDIETARMKNVICGCLDDHIDKKYSKQLAQVQGLRDLAVDTALSKWENDSDDLRQMSAPELAVLIFDYHYSQSDVIYY